MNKSQFYLSECAEAASKSPMCFKLGAVMVKGGKVISTGYNHHRPHYDGAEVHKHGHRKPVSMHAEMHAIFTLTGMSPSFKKQVQGVERRVPQRTGPPERPPFEPPIPKGSAAPERRLSGAWNTQAFAEDEESMEEIEDGRPKVADECSKWQQQQWGRAKGWDARRRDSRVNGADIYVARITKSGCGNARPCWRCLEWCKWAGVKRIFHWNEELNKFDVVKVNNAERDQYETHADIRLHAGLGW
ncbi:hypothetical protein BD410DRAFT_799957 [Rickenella mellea]|uniref:CMP/dCMP-type deaminase domain-containing protein n=1 Tax=Rickenella mellea TaxID=50990 RepID=A0A4Y7QIV7_9AGAM|nr:hypothetical protein BD410DRAFT_799957 [Rickenella mellea]